MSDKNIAPIEEVSISAELTESGVKAGAKSRAVAALDRLLGGAVDLVGAPVEGLRDRIRARNENREALIRAAGQIAIERLAGDPGLNASLIEGQIADAARKAENKEAIAIEFLEELRSEPGEQADTPDPIDPDWLNMFSSHAENASSEHLRTLWARILAGQVRAPGRFSLATLRFVSELDKSIAELFQSRLSSIVFDQFLIKPKELKGQDLIDLTFLEEVGLLIEVNGMLGMPQQNGPDGYKYNVQGNFLLRMRMSSEARIELIKLTRVGREIASILPKAADEQVLMDIFASVESNVAEADLNLITERSEGGSVSFTMIRKIK